MSAKTKLETRIIVVYCCKVPMVQKGFMARAGCAGAENTILAYECEKCFDRVSITDTWGKPNAETIALIDETE